MRSPPWERRPNVTVPQSRLDTSNPVVDQRYELIELIGSGAAAHVYRARDLLLRREVAVKMLTEEAASDPAFVERFQREARAIASFNHPNIMTVYDWGTADDLDYMVMEYVRGGSLSDVLAERHRLGEHEALELAAEVARALAAAHERGIVHRDIKPDNILLSLDGRPKVADFGIAWAQGLSDLTITNTITGTVSYISPEQARGTPVDGRSDLYSLGVVLYQMVTGQLPFRGSSMVDTALQHIQDDPVPPRQIRPDVSPQTERIILTALAKHPENRYSSAMAMVEALEGSRSVDSPLPAKAVPIEPEQTTVRAPLGPLPEQTPSRGRPLPVQRRTSFASRAVWVIPIGLLALLSGVALAAHPWDAPHQQRAAPPAAHPTSPAAASTHTTAAHRTGGSTTPHSAGSHSSTPSSGTSRSSAGRSAPAGAGTPQDAVIKFYTDIGYHRFAAARQLWSPALQQKDPPSIFIDQHFANTQSIWVNPVSLLHMDPVSGSALVGVRITETDAPDGTSRQYSGSWELVRQNGRWFLNQPDLHQIAVAPPTVAARPPGHEKGPAKDHGKHGKSKPLVRVVPPHLTVK